MQWLQSLIKLLNTGAFTAPRRTWMALTASAVRTEEGSWGSGERNSGSLLPPQSPPFHLSRKITSLPRGEPSFLPLPGAQSPTQLLLQSFGGAPCFLLLLPPSHPPPPSQSSWRQEQRRWRRCWPGNNRFTVFVGYDNILEIGSRGKLSQSSTLKVMHIFFSSLSNFFACVFLDNSM